MTVDYNTVYHIAFGLAGTIAAYELLARTTGMPRCKAIAYACAIVTIGGLVKEANDVIQIIPFPGELDLIDIIANSIGVFAGAYAETRGNLSIAAKGLADIVQDTYCAYSSHRRNIY